MTIKEAIEVLEEARPFFIKPQDDEGAKLAIALGIAVDVMKNVNAIQFNVYALNELLNRGGNSP